LLGEIEPDKGSVRLSPRASIGYLRQTHEHLDRESTIWQYLQSVIVSLDGGARASEQQARDLAGAFLFSGQDQEKAIGNLSGGEKMRMVLAGLMASAKNLLVLDEPTNHLDIPSAERLEETLAKEDEEGGYAGALLLISHDRALLESTCERLIVLDGEGGVEVWEGSYSDWHAAHQRRRSAAQAAVKASAAADAKRKAAGRQGAIAAAPPKVQAQPQAGPLAKLSMSEVEQRIERIDGRIRSIDEQIRDPKVYSDPKRMKKLQSERQSLESEKEPLEFEWVRRVGE